MSSSLRALARAAVRATSSSVVFAAVLALSGCTATTSGGDRGREAPASPDTGASGEGSASAASGTVPEAVVGTWTAGRGGTTVSYDAIAGTSAPSNASGLAFQFAADGTFAKAYRDSNGGSCPMIVLATESGKVTWGDADLQLRSEHGESRMWSSCTPGSVATEPLAEADLDRARYTFVLDGDELVLTRTTDGASARFRRSR